MGFSLPSFLTGLLLMLVFAINLGWFPIVYNSTLQVTDWNTFMQQIRQMVLPVTVLVVQQTGAITRFMRSSMLDSLPLDFVRTARAKGLSERMVVMRHVMRNSLIPVVTLVALGIPTIFTGRNRDRESLSRQRDWLTVDYVDSERRYAHGHGVDLYLCRPDCPVQPGCRRHLWAA